MAAAEAARLAAEAVHTVPVRQEMDVDAVSDDVLQEVDPENVRPKGEAEETLQD